MSSASDTQSAYFCIDSSSNFTCFIFESTIFNEVDIAIEDIDPPPSLLAELFPENTEIDESVEVSKNSSTRKCSWVVSKSTASTEE